MRTEPSAPRTLREAAAVSLAIDAATVEAVDALAAAGIAALLLKGPALARLLYDAGEERSWDDADLLVEPAAHAAAMEVLGGAGFAPSIASATERSTVPYAVHLVRPSRAPGVDTESIDLHQSFAGVAGDPAGFWSSLSRAADSIELFGRPVPVPSVPARLALVALHAGSHGPGHDRSLRDLVRAVERFDADAWSPAWDLAQEWRAEDLFVVGVGLAPGGAALLEGIGARVRPGIGALMRGAGKPRGQLAVEQLARERGLVARLRLALRKLFPSPGFMRAWTPLARRGPGGLALAYLWRPFWLLGRLAAVACAYARARRR